MDAVSAFYFAHPFWVWLAIGAVFRLNVVSLWPRTAAA